MRVFFPLKFCLLALLVIACAVCTGHAVTTGAGGNSITSPDTADDVGYDTSLTLDSSGNPVVSYWDRTNNRLKVLHCDDPYCSGDESAHITSPDSGGGRWTSIALDASGNPVVSYYTQIGGTPGYLKVLHCGNTTCTSGNSVASPDGTVAGNVPQSSSLALDAAEKPVVAFGRDYLKVLHCGNPYCTEGNSINGNITSSMEPSLALDSDGHPVVSYYSTSPCWGLNVLHCGDEACSSGNSITCPEDGNNGQWNSLALDSHGYPVVSYVQYGVGPYLKVLHCGDANCTSGNTITSADTGADGVTSLALDSHGYPVVSYAGGGHLKVLHCGNANCTSGSIITSPDTAGHVGAYSSLALDGGGYPVVSYLDSTNGDLKVLHCVDPACTGVALVGGVAEPPTLAGASDEEAGGPAEGSGWSAGGYAALAGGLGAAAVAIAGGWYAKRRWLR